MNRAALPTALTVRSLFKRPWPGAVRPGAGRMRHGCARLFLVWTVAPPGMADTLLNVRHQLASKESVSEVS